MCHRDRLFLLTSLQEKGPRRQQQKLQELDWGSSTSPNTLTSTCKFPTIFYSE
jgi:hypothetical protein